MKKYLTEGIGTFFLVLVVILAANNGAGNLLPLALGATLTALLYAGKHVSGAHYNPALTLAMLMRKKIDRTDALYYVVAQVAGGILASLFGVFLLNCSQRESYFAHSNSNAICALVAEFLGAFALSHVFLNVMVARETTGNSYFGIAAGFVLAGATWAFGGISGGLFNPAVAIGASIAGLYEATDLWIYLIGSVLGAAAAASVFQVVFGNQE